MARLTAEQVVDELRRMVSERGDHEGPYDLALAGEVEVITAIASIIRANLIQSEEESRAEFEAWVRSLPDFYDGDVERLPVGGDYVRHYTCTQWQAWQASRTWRPADERDQAGD